MGAATIRLAEDFPGSVRSEPGSTVWTRPGGTCSWPLDLFESRFGRIAKGKWTVLANGPPPSTGEPAPTAPSAPPWVKDYPAGDWRDFVRVAKHYGFDGRSKADAIAFLLNGEDGPISEVDFHTKLNELGDD